VEFVSSGGVEYVALSLIGSRVNKFLAPLLGCLRSLAVGLPFPWLPPPRERAEGVCLGSSRGLESPRSPSVILPLLGLPSLKGERSSSARAATIWPHSVGIMEIGGGDLPCLHMSGKLGSLVVFLLVFL
jgi:hypothetical protein